MFLAMSSSPTSRKRPAPGTSPLPAAPTQQLPQYTTHDQMMRYNDVAANGNNYADVSSQYMSMPQPQAPLTNIYQSQSQPQSQAQTPSNVLALRDSVATSRALVPTAQRPEFDGQPDQWTTNQTRDLVPTSNGVRVQDEEEMLIQLMAKAKKIEEEATKDNPSSNQKRSIPPFVLKLARYVCPCPLSLAPTDIR